MNKDTEFGELYKTDLVIRSPRPPDDDLVEKMMDIVNSISDENRFSNYARKEVPEEIRKLLQSRQPGIDKELNDVIKVLYTSEKLQLTSCDITKLANRLEAIEKLLQSRQPEKVSVTRGEIIDFNVHFPMLGTQPTRREYIPKWLKSKDIEVVE